jgi:hypothetical protein
VPHTEVGRILIGGAESDLSALAGEGDMIDVLPAGGGIDRGLGRSPGGAAESDAPPPAQEGSGAPAFILDVHLGKLATLLRLLGFDALYGNDWDDPELARIADTEGRILLTRNRQLLKRRRVRRGYCVRADVPMTQAREVLERFALHPLVRAWSRCLACNGPIRPATKGEVWDRLEPKTKLYYSRFHLCLGCGRVYWEGSHHAALERLIHELI